jgi:lipoprotein-releasing system permease protein
VKVYLWLAYRFLKASHSTLLSPTGLISLLGLIIGVASLVVSLSVVSGFETTLKQSIIDVAGDVQIYNFEPEALPLEEIKKLAPDLKNYTSFFSVEGVAAFNGQVKGIFIQALNPQSVNEVLNLKKRVVEGDFDLTQEGLVLGRTLAQKMGVKVGDLFNVIVPLKNELVPGDFKRIILPFKVSGVINFGKYEFDERLLLANEQFLRSRGLLKQRAPGMILKLQDSEKARWTADRLMTHLSGRARVRDWKEFSENLFEAVKIERAVIFFIILVIVIAAAFNVSITQYINVVRKYADISILKTMGVSKKNLILIFCCQGLLMSCLGLIFGFTLGFVLSSGFELLEVYYDVLPSSVYKIDQIDLHLRAWDAFYIIASTLFVCLISSVAPAVKGASLPPVEGLRYD